MTIKMKWALRYQNEYFTSQLLHWNVLSKPSNEGRLGRFKLMTRNQNYVSCTLIIWYKILLPPYALIFLYGGYEGNKTCFPFNVGWKIDLGERCYFLSVYFAGHGTRCVSPLRSLNTKRSKVPSAVYFWLSFLDNHNFLHPRNSSHSKIQ